MGINAIRYIMFDFDGTLIDSMPFLEKNAVSLLTQYYEISEDEAKVKYRETTGLPFVQQIQLIFPNNTRNTAVVDEFEKMKIKRIYKQKPFNDALSVLKALKQRNFLLGISSGTIESIITTYLKKIKFDFVNDILGYRSDFQKGKDHFNFVQNKHSLTSSEIIFIGDSLNDAKRAKQNQIDFIGKTGMFQQDQFNEIIPNCRMINKLSEILELI